jgi:AraC-like DNA-binding protein
MLSGTASTHVVRLVRDAALAAGVPDPLLTGLPGADDASLSAHHHRVPLATLVRIWDLLAHTLPPGAAGLHVADAAPLGALPAWDYLLVNGATLADALTASLPYHQVVTAAEEVLSVEDDGALTVGYQTLSDDSRTSAAVHEYVLAYYLRRAREATRRDLVPEAVRFRHPAPPRHGALVRAFGTAVEFGASANTITFRAEDARAPLPEGDPRLGSLLRDHAAHLLATARPLPDWHDLFRAALDAELDAGAPALDAVASRLAMSTRTLQRRLAEHGTTWRHEVDLARYARARSLLADDRLTVDAVAGRLGFTDDRALRKAFRRWSGHSPEHERRTLAHR